MTTIRTVVALTAHKGWHVHQLDIKPTFLNGVLKEEVYVSQPLGFVKKGAEHQVYKLHKALYGLKQVSRAWYQKIHAYLVAHGFKISPTESTLYVYKDGVDLLILNLYVDDLPVIGPDEDKILAFILAYLQHAFDVTDLGLLHYYLGIQFLHVECGIWLSQQRYIEKLLM